MKLSILIISILLCCVVSVNAEYTYVVIDGYESLTLNDHETLLMTGGGGYHLSLFDYSHATIQGTSPLIEFTGGIWELGIGGYTQLDFSGGEVHEFNIHSAGRAAFSGGRIDEIRSYQIAWKWDGDPLEWVPDQHIEIVCHDDWFHDTGTNILTGTWFDDSTFDIQLVDVDGYDPVIENIFFTPEPATLLLITVGGLLLRRRRYHL